MSASPFGIDQFLFSNAPLSNSILYSSLSAAPRIMGRNLRFAAFWLAAFLAVYASAAPQNVTRAATLEKLSLEEIDDQLQVRQ